MNWKTIIGGGIIALGIEYALCVAVANFQDYENYYEQGFYYLAVIWAVQIAIWFKTTIVSTIYYWVWAKNRAASEIADQFTKLGFPAFDEYDTVDDWLNQIMYDESLSHDAQLGAAALVGQIAFSRSQGMQPLFRLIGIIKLAAQKHTRRLPIQVREIA